MKIIRIFLGLSIMLMSSFFVATAIGMPDLTYPLCAGSVIISLAMPSGSMFSIINIGSITFNGEEVKALSEAVLETLFAKPDLNKIHTLVRGIVAKKQIAILGQLGLVGTVDPGCDPDDSDASIPISEKFWDPTGVFTRLAQCYKALEASFFVWGQNKGVKRPDLTNGDFVNFVEERMIDAITEATWRLSWFGDTDAAAYTASPPGTLGSSAYVKYFNLFDGFWKQAFSIAVADTDRRYVIDENALDAEALQKALAADRTLGSLRN